MHNLLSLHILKQFIGFGIERSIKTLLIISQNGSIIIFLESIGRTFNIFLFFNSYYFCRCNIWINIKCLILDHLILETKILNWSSEFSFWHNIIHHFKMFLTIEKSNCGEIEVSRILIFLLSFKSLFHVQEKVL